MPDDKAQWKNGDKIITGQWRYVWHRDVFVIHLDSIDEITGQRRSLEVYNDSPEWGDWKLCK